MDFGGVFLTKKVLSFLSNFVCVYEAFQMKSGGLDFSVQNSLKCFFFPSLIFLPDSLETKLYVIQWDEFGVHKNRRHIRLFFLFSVMNPKKCPETEKNYTWADFSSNCYAANLQFEAGNPDIPKKHIFIFVCIEYCRKQILYFCIFTRHDQPIDVIRWGCPRASHCGIHLSRFKQKNY